MIKEKIIVLIAGLSTLLAGCDWNNSKPVDTRPVIKIVKFHHPSYKDYVIAREEGEYFVLDKISNAYDFPPNCHRNPYWELVDGWCLIDWNLRADSQRLYPYGNLFLKRYDPYWNSYNFILLDVPIESYMDYLVGGKYGKFIFNKDLKHIKLPQDSIFEQKYIFLCNINNYMDSIDSNYSFIRNIDDGNNLCEKAEYMNNRWQALQLSIITIINNGDLDYVWKKNYP